MSAVRRGLPRVVRGVTRLWGRLSVNLISAMLLTVVVMAVSMVALSAYSVRRQFEQLPPELRAQFEARNAQRRAEDLRNRSYEQAMRRRYGEPPLRPRPTPSGPRFQNQLTNSLTGAALISGTLAVLLGGLLARRIARPIEGVSAAARRVAHGDLSVRAPEQPSSLEVLALTRNFNGMADALERLEGERRNMIADIAHELRTPLAVMQARLDALADGVLPMTPGEIGVLSQQVELLTRLVGDLRTLSLAEAHQLSLDRTTFDARDLVAHVARSFESRAHARTQMLRTHLPTGPAPLHADRDRLAQALGNLLDNALRHTPDAGVVQLSVRAEADAVTFAVRDSGAGFPEDAAPRLFDRFYRVHGARDRATGGSGLGLAIVQAITALHGGHVTARNHPDGGAEFTLTLPSVQAADARRAAA
ncbi:sensor histidine kinase [Deinococcus maricopensis]|uniref:histidine kinase n=1 Tax=Deinococcus maricopensis (strain DSM 21211 / LMG 22137 / NRRL B-23946 / LB-34) TaxID=709986 RepID=E8U661_DEIML|nr:ATP-binding protein [Deinococcus maricopensis]ADV66550.1 integral membrane sensor signal transduction histidine kinase [Deinococcus maricopensis DSM 21211]